MLSDEKDYATDIPGNVEKMGTFNTKSGSNLPQINQAKYFKADEVMV